MSDHLHDLRILRRQMVASELRQAAESLWSIRDYPAFGEDDIRAAVGILRDMGYLDNEPVRKASDQVPVCLVAGAL